MYLFYRLPWIAPIIKEAIITELISLCTSVQYVHERWLWWFGIMQFDILVICFGFRKGVHIVCPFVTMQHTKSLWKWSHEPTCSWTVASFPAHDFFTLGKLVTCVKNKFQARADFFSTCWLNLPRCVTLASLFHSEISTSPTSPTLVRRLNWEVFPQYVYYKMWKFRKFHSIVSNPAFGKQESIPPRCLNMLPVHPHAHLPFPQPVP